MIRIGGLAIGVFAAGLMNMSPAQSGTGNLQISGQWSLAPGLTPDKVHLTLHWKRDRHTMNSTMEWSLDRLEGLSTTQLKSGGTPVNFRLAREAGTLNCEGYIKSGSGGGVFSFSINKSFVDAMSALGYSGLTDEQLYAMAIHDVSTAYVREMRGEGVQMPAVNDLLPMRIHRVTAEYVREFKHLGYTEFSPGKLVSMRIHGVTPEFARELGRLGYSSVPFDKLVSMRIHGVTTEFVRELETLGYRRVGIDQLVSMKIHGVTPEFIRKLQGRGMKDLTIDKMVSLKIHGIVD
jgi:hypothetical protein